MLLLHSRGCSQLCACVPEYAAGSNVGSCQDDPIRMTSDSFRSKIHALTGVRFLAAIAVVFYHYWGDLMPGVPTHRIFESGFMGVSFFYVLSGYILAHVYLRSERPEIDSKKFYIARFARVYPAYALSLLVQFPLIYWVLVHGRTPLKRTLIALGTLNIHVLLLQAWCPFLNWRWNQPSWSVSVEAFFYLLFPVLGLWSLRHRSLSRIAALIGLCYALMMIPALALLAHGTGWNEASRPLSFQFVVFSPLLRIPEFMIGVFASILHRRLRLEWDHARILRAGTQLTYLGVAVIAVVVILGRDIPYVLRYNGIADIGFAAVILGLSESPTLPARVFSLKPMVLLGEASYSIYILQAPIVDYFRLLLPRFHGPLLFSAYLLTLMASSIFCFLFIESPVRERINGWYSGRQRNAVAADIPDLVPAMAIEEVS